MDNFAPGTRCAVFRTGTVDGNIEVMWKVPPISLFKALYPSLMSHLEFIREHLYSLNVVDLWSTSRA